MSEPFLSEIKIFSQVYAPRNWAQCNGQFLPINQNQALFSLLGTTYGGNGQTTFALPDLRGKVPLSFGSGFILGQTGGQEAHTLTLSEMPQHLHFAQVSNDDATADVPDATMVLAKASLDIYRAPTTLTAMNTAIIGNVGGSQPHQNQQPFLVLNFCIALVGIFPSQN